MKDPSESPIPTMFADEEDICEHKKLHWECYKCEGGLIIDSLIDERKENDEAT